MRNVLLCWLLGLLTCITNAQTGAEPERLRISILTCGTGDELYASFGHTAVRITDSVRGTDLVYNYGTFDFTEPDFYSKFTLGKLLYFLDKEPFNSFLNNYEQEGRGVAEQVLNLGPADRVKMLAFLENNLLPENRSYRYDFLFDNCATRVRDILPRILNSSFHYGAVPGIRQVSFRQVIDRYLAGQPWQRLGIDIILGSPVDKRMNDSQAMFLPDYLYTGLQQAQYNGKQFTTGNRLLEAKADPFPEGQNQPFMVLFLLLLLVLAVHFVAVLKRFRRGLDIAILLVSGLLGLQLLFMWLFTNHQACANNWNILWAFPPNVFMAFAWQGRFRKYYCFCAVGALVAALIIHFSGVQQLPLKEITPLLAALLVIYLRNINYKVSQEAGKTG